MNPTPYEKSKQKNGEFIPNFTQYPNEILDNWMPYLSGNQTKIINVFVRQIYGYHKDCDRISIRQISQKTGITTSKVFKDIKILISIGCIKILKKGDKNTAHLYQILNITEELPKRIGNKINKGVTPEVTGCYPRDNSCVTPEVTVELPQREQQKKEINIKEKCEIKESQQQAHTPQVKLEDIKQDDYLRNFANMLGVNLDAITEEEYTKPSTEIALPKRTEEEINLHYSQEIAKVEQELFAQRDINLPKLSTESLLGASEEFLSRVGIGFDNNPRRILNLIYKSLPSDCVIKEDSKDVEILGDMIKKYMASRQDERESIAKRIYQAVEAMLKIYVIKKYGEPYREVLYPEILRANLTLYINCNPTFKYCLGGFSNDIDGVYSEVCRLVEKDNKKKINLLKAENEKKLRQLEANRRADLQSIFSEQELADFERRKSNIMDRSNARGFDEPELDKPIKVNLTEAEKEEMRELFGKQDKSSEDVIRLNFLIAKSKK